MSKQAVAAFLAKLAEDEQLQKALVEFASRHGFEFSTDELAEVDLDAVAGGLSLGDAITPIGGTTGTAGLPDLRPGGVVELRGLGDRLNDSHSVDQTTHQLDDGSYDSEFDTDRESGM